MIRGVRGATTIPADQPDQILIATQELAMEMARVNSIQAEDVASVIISTTPDVISAFPAKAVRTIEGWEYVPVMCMHEMSVAESLPRCIRIMMHVNTTVAQNQVEHIYLNEAVTLRPDLVKK
ncbi:chorismate mutase [Chryseomicrobium aureum]|uniref:chorismate mutase n=1 Tax=Chryseomicrobium aureum TaxID=1441723 RepID=UPI001956D99E|nr:chorismate mutase [Chryseomicrobium aureum]MBM7705520.1 chorismate mutase [Chryseomicrobium aureum]